MAILNKIRQKTVVLILVIALALFAFILSSLFDNRDALFGKSPNVVATINGKDISREVFMAKVELQQQRMGPNASQSQVMNAVFEQEVRAAVMEQQYEKLDMSIEADQMKDLMKASLANRPEFQNEAGLFDETKLNTYIANIKEASDQAYQNWVDGEKNMASGALQTNYFNLVKAGSVATLAEGILEHKLESEKVDIRYVQIPFRSIADSTIQVSESEIKTYIKDNKSKYKEEATRNIQYVFFKEEASAQDEKNIQDDLTKLLNDTEELVDGKKEIIKGFLSTEDAGAFVNLNSDTKFVDKYQYKTSLSPAITDTIFKFKAGEIFGPYKEGGSYKLTKVVDFKTLADSIQSSHIIIPFVGSQAATATTTATKEEAKTQIDSIFALVKNSKTKFAEVANEINTDGTKGKDGSIGWIRLTNYNPENFDPDFADFLFFNKKESIDVVLTKFGYHIIRIDDKKNEEQAVKVATIERKIESSEETNDQIFKDASNFELEIANKDFLESAKAINYEVRPVTGIKELDENIPGVGNQRPIVRWAFEEESKVGDYKRFNVSGGTVIAEVTMVNNEGLKSIADASVTALPELRKQKKAELIKSRVSATTLEDLATAEEQQVRTATNINMKNPTVAGAGREPLVVGNAFGLAEGGTSGLIVGNSGVFMVQVTKKTPAVELDNYQSFANQVGTQKLSAVQSRLYDALKEAAEIEDNRANTVQ